MKKKGEIELYNLNKEESDSKAVIIVLNVSISDQEKTCKVSFTKLQEISPRINEKYNKDNFKESFPLKLSNIQKQYNVSPAVCWLFLDLISGKSINLTFENSFDFYKLSYIFKIEDCLKQIKDYWKITDNIINDIFQYLLKFDRSIQSTDQNDFLSNFIALTEIPKQLEEFIDDFFKNDYSISFIQIILEDCDEKKIPNDILFNYIMKEKVERLCLLKFLDFRNLSNDNKNKFMMFLLDQHCSLVKSNTQYLMKYKAKNKDEEIEYLVNSSKNGNLVASYDLYCLYKSSEQKDKSQQYKEIYQNQKNMSSIFEDIRSKVHKDKDSHEKVQKAAAKDKDSHEQTNKATVKDKDSREQTKKAITNENSNKETDNGLTSTRSNSKHTQKQEKESFYDSNSDDTNADDNGDADEDGEYNENLDDDDDDDELAQSRFTKTESHKTVNLHKKPGEISKYKSIGNSGSKNHGYKKPHFTDEELKNQKIWLETERIVKEGFYYDFHKGYNDIKAKVEDSIKKTYTIHKDANFDDKLADKFKNKKSWGQKDKKEIYSKIEVSYDSTFGAAKKLKDENIKEVCVLNFASATKPGGGVKNGRKAQEETLSRQSTLYFSISKQNEMYDYHKVHTIPFYTHYMIYSPNVVVIRDDSYKLIPNYRVSVITSAAVNYNDLLKIYPKGSKDKDILTCMKTRCRKILQLAIINNNKAIVLGAFGCGVFGNKPEDISKIFKELLVDEFYGKFFTKIVFAIKGTPGKFNANYNAFKAAFKPSS